MTEAEMQYTAEWWESRSSHELNELIQRGLSGGGIFDGAARELERREADRRARDTDAAAIQRKKRVMHRAVLALSLLCLALALAVVARVTVRSATQTAGEGTHIG
jgi:hypothetical protein